MRNKINLYVSLVVVLLISFISIGYAAYKSELNAMGTINLNTEENNLTFSKFGVRELNKNNVLELNTNSFNITSGINLTTNIVANLVYDNNLNIEYVVTNNTEETYTYRASSGSINLVDKFNNNIAINYPVINNLSSGDKIKPHESKTFSIDIVSREEAYDGYYVLNANLIFTFKTGDDTSSEEAIAGSLSKNMGLISDNKSDLSIILNNLYDSTKEITLVSKNPLVKIVNSDLSDLSNITLNKGELATIDVALLTESDDVNTSIYAICDGDEYYLGMIELSKDEKIINKTLKNVYITPVINEFEGKSELAFKIANYSGKNIKEWRIKMPTTSPNITSDNNYIEINEGNLIIYSYNNHEKFNHIIIDTDNEITLTGFIGEAFSIDNIKIDALIDDVWHLDYEFDNKNL